MSDTTAPADPQPGAALPDSESAALYGMLVRLASAADREAANLTSIRTSLDRVDGLLDTLVRHVTDVTAVRAVDERLAAAVERMEAGEESIGGVLEAVTRLGRDQFKANVLAEAQDQRVGAALEVLQSLATRREDLASQEVATGVDDRAQIRSDGRAEFGAELLPALDGLEASLKSGRVLVERQRAAEAASRQVPSQPGLTARLRAALGPKSPAAPPSGVAVDALEAWLTGLELVRRRLLDRLASEDIVPIEALGQPFDAHQHVAVNAEPRADLAEGTVVSVLRPGYRRGTRIVRYAEVTVARSAQHAAADDASTRSGEAS